MPAEQTNDCVKMGTFILVRSGSLEILELSDEHGNLERVENRVPVGVDELHALRF